MTAAVQRRAVEGSAEGPGGRRVAAVRRMLGRLRRDDRGSGAAAVLIFAVLFLALAAFVIDGGLSISQRERATDIAEQAARYAAQDTDKEAVYQGGKPPINYEHCPQRVTQFVKRVGLQAGDVSGSQCVGGSAQQVQVRVQLTYRPVLTGLFYSAPIEVHGQATAESVTG